MRRERQSPGDGASPEPDPQESSMEGDDPDEWDDPSEATFQKIVRRRSVERDRAFRSKREREHRKR